MEYYFTNKSIAESLYDAFQAEPFYLAIAKARSNQLETEKEALLKYFDFTIQEAKKYGILHTLEDPEIGASIWHKPQADNLYEQQVKAKKTFIKEHLGMESFAIYKKMEQFMEVMEEAVIEDHYWYLSILAVGKRHQRKGYGRQLLTPVLAEADQLGIPTFLETFTKGNLVFYGKLNYKVVAEYIVPTLDKTCWILVRHPA